MKVRNVNLGRNYELDDDLYKGLRDSVQTNRSILAVQYLLEIVEDLRDRVIELELVLAESRVAVKPAAKAPAKAAKTEVADAATESDS